MLDSEHIYMDMLDTLLDVRNSFIRISSFALFSALIISASMDLHDDDLNFWEMFFNWDSVISIFFMQEPLYVPRIILDR